MLLHQISSRTGFVKTRHGQTWVKVVGRDLTERTPAIFLHGGPGFPHDYFELLEPLSEGRTLVFYDQVGCGRSSRPTDKSVYTLETYVEELEAVRTALGISSFHLVGSSWGTMLGMDYYLAHPERVSSIVFQSPCLSARDWGSDAAKLCQQMGPEWNALVLKYEAEGTTASTDYTQAKKEFSDRFVCRISPTPLPIERSKLGFGTDTYMYMWGPSEFTPVGTLKDYDRTPQLPTIKVPTLFLCGRHDEATPETVARHAALVPGATLEIFEDCAHAILVENPQGVMTSLRRFWEF